MKDTIYKRKPAGFINGIPLFSDNNDFIESYEQLSHEEVEGYELTGNLTLDPEEIRTEVENTTIELINKYAVEGQKILDVGLGWGTLLEKYPHLERYGIDISLTFLEKARSKGITVAFSLIEDMPYRDDFFDVVISTDVLEHVIDLNRCVASILATLKPGGVFIVRVPYKGDLSTYADPACPYEYAHLRSFDEHALTLLFRNIFKCEVLEYTKAVYYYPKSFLRQKFWMNFLINFFWRMKKALPGLHNLLKQRLLEPLEINMVVRKPAG